MAWDVRSFDGNVYRQALVESASKYGREREAKGTREIRPRARGNKAEGTRIIVEMSRARFDDSPLLAAPCSVFRSRGHVFSARASPGGCVGELVLCRHPALGSIGGGRRKCRYACVETACNVHYMFVLRRSPKHADARLPAKTSIKMCCAVCAAQQTSTVIHKRVAQIALALVESGVEACAYRVRFVQFTDHNR